MSVFTTKEIEYLRVQRIGRVATVNAAGQPHVVPVAFRYYEEGDAIEIGGHNFAKSKMYRDAGVAGPAALLVDDVLPPRRARGDEVRGTPRSSGRVVRRSVLAVLASLRK